MYRRPFFIVLLMMLCYSYVLPRWADWSQTSRLALVRAIVEQGTVRIDSYVGSTGDYASVDGHVYSDKAPGPALLAVPIYALVWQIVHWTPVSRVLERIAQTSALSGTLRADGAGLGVERVTIAFSHYVLVMVVVALPAALAVAALDWLLQRWIRPGPALVGVVSYGLATPVAPYAANFYSHALVAALLISAWSLLERARSAYARRNHYLAASGLLLGLATISEYPVVLVCGVLGMYATMRFGWRSGLWLVFGGLPGVAALVIYDWIAFSTPWPIGYAHSALWQDQHHTGFMSLTYPHPEALWGLTGGQFRGLFVRSPWLLLALPGVVAWWRSGRLRPELFAAAAATTTLWLFYGSSRMWWGGFGIGPRYLVPLIPFVTLLAVWWIDYIWEQPWWRWSVIGLVVLSILLVWAESLAGQQFPPDTIHNPWIDWTLPAWQRGDIARNVGMAVGLRGGWSLLPLLVASAFILRAIVQVPHSPRAVPGREAALPITR